MTDFRAELEALIEAADHHVSPYQGHHAAWDAALDRARAALASAPAPAGGTAPPPASDGGVAELAEFLRIYGDHVMDEYGDVGEHEQLTRAADLMERQQPRPVPVAERPWEREGWCDAEGRCWFLFLLSNDPTWTYEHYTSGIAGGRTLCLPHDALPTP